MRISIELNQSEITQLQSEAFLMGCSVEEAAYRFIAKSLPKKQEKSPDEYKDFMKLYFEFYESRTGAAPMITAADGKAAKAIIKHFRIIDRNNVIVNWNAVLRGWNNLTPFYKSQINLRQIHSNFNNIVNELSSKKRTAAISGSLKGL